MILCSRINGRQQKRREYVAPWEFLIAWCCLGDVYSQEICTYQLWTRLCSDSAEVNGSSPIVPHKTSRSSAYHGNHVLMRKRFQKRSQRNNMFWQREQDRIRRLWFFLSLRSANMVFHVSPKQRSLLSFKFCQNWINATEKSLWADGTIQQVRRLRSCLCLRSWETMKENSWTSTLNPMDILAIVRAFPIPQSYIYSLLKKAGVQKCSA